MFWGHGVLGVTGPHRFTGPGGMDGERAGLPKKLRKNIVIS